MNYIVAHFKENSKKKPFLSSFLIGTGKDPRKACLLLTIHYNIDIIT